MPPPPNLVHARGCGRPPGPPSLQASPRLLLRLPPRARLGINKAITATEKWRNANKHVSLPGGVSSRLRPHRAAPGSGYPAVPSTHWSGAGAAWITTRQCFEYFLVCPVRPVGTHQEYPNGGTGRVRKGKGRARARASSAKHAALCARLALVASVGGASVSHAAPAIVPAPAGAAGPCEREPLGERRAEPRCVTAGAAGAGPGRPHRPGSNGLT